MTRINKGLLLFILSMDAYNRGWHATFKFQASGDIGNLNLQ